MRSKIFATMAIAGLAMGHSASAALFTTSLEATEGYTTGNLIGQKDWTAPFSTTSGMSVINASDDGLTAPDGVRVGKIVRGLGNTRASHALDAAAISTPFSVTVYMAYDEAGTDGTSAVAYISDTAGSFNGVIFGFNKPVPSGTDTHFQYRSGNTFIDVPGTGTPAERTFYKFVADVRPADSKYDLAVYDMNNTLLGSVTGASVRGAQTSYQYLNVTNLDDQNDLMWFDMPAAAVPEPASGAFIIGMLSLGLSRRRR